MIALSWYNRFIIFQWRHQVRKQTPPFVYSCVFSLSLTFFLGLFFFAAGNFRLPQVVDFFAAFKEFIFVLLEISMVEFLLMLLCDFCNIGEASTPLTLFVGAHAVEPLISIV